MLLATGEASNMTPSTISAFSGDEYEPNGDDAGACASLGANHCRSHLNSPHSGRVAHKPAAAVARSRCGMAARSKPEEVVVDSRYVVQHRPDNPG